MEAYRDWKVVTTISDALNASPEAETTPDRRMLTA